MKLTLLAAALWLAQAQPAPVQPVTAPEQPPKLDQQRLEDLGVEPAHPRHPWERKFRPVQVPTPQGGDRG